MRNAPAGPMRKAAGAKYAGFCGGLSPGGCSFQLNLPESASLWYDCIYRTNFDAGPTLIARQRLVPLARIPDYGIGALRVFDKGQERLGVPLLADVDALAAQYAFGRQQVQGRMIEFSRYLTFRGGA